MGNRKIKAKTFGWVLRMALGTFVLAIIFGLVTELLLQRVLSLIISLIILVIVIMIGVISDTIGTSAAAANLSPLNAKAARKEEGARKGVDLVKNADRVSNFCNDVVGDITGIISGAVAAVIVFNLLIYSEGAEFYARIILTAMVAALTVGGKAWGKNLALRRSTEIMLKVGLILTRAAKFSPANWKIFRKKTQKKQEK